MSAQLEAAVTSAQKATLELHGLMAIHGISFQELRLLLEWPAGLREAHEAWTARMADVIRKLAREKGVPDASKMSERDLIALTNRAYDLVMS